MRVAVVGIYRSGSSFWAGCLHHLGVDMGGPFWENDIENHPDNHYEPWDLSIDLRAAWNEPQCDPVWESERRVRTLREWIVNRETTHAVCGAKHPLFCVALPDVLAAWGDDTVIVHAYRPLEESVDSLLRTTFPWPELEMYRVEHKLWRAAKLNFEHRKPDLSLSINAASDESLRRIAIDQLIDRIGLKPTKNQIENAVNGFRTP